MLLRHSAAYLVARGLPGLVNFAALAIYSRLLAPEDYGRYALLIAGVSMAGVIVFQWHRLVLARWLAARQEDQQRFLGEILRVFLLLAMFAALVGLALAAASPDLAWQRLLAVAVALLIVQEWVELNLILAAAQFAPARYGRMLGAKTALALAVGTGLALAGWGATAPLVGLVVGSALAVPLFGRAPWRGVRPVWPARNALDAQLRYGLPLAVTFALGWVIASSDRLLIGWLLDIEAAGRYAVGYDLAQNSLGVLLAIVQVAAYPLAVRALEERGPEAAQEQIRRNGELILCLALSSAAALAVLAPQIAAVVVGAEFRETTASLLPWVGLAAAIAGVKAFHFDMVFHLQRDTRGLLAGAVFSAMANVALNLALIPRFGLLGAAWGTVIAYAFGASISAYLGRRSFRLPPFMPMALRAAMVAASTVAGCVIATSADRLSVVLQLSAGFGLGGMATVFVMFLIDLAHIRTEFRAWRRKHGHTCLAH